MKFTVFQPAQTAKELIQRFVEEFFTGNSDMAVNIPEVQGFKWNEDPEMRLVNISESFSGHMNQENDGLPETTFPLILITYPDFSQIDTGIGSVINKQDDYRVTGPDMESFPYHDKLKGMHLDLSYKTEEERTWQILRYHYGFSFSIDIVSNELESRQKLADLVRVMMDQYIAFQSPFHNLSVPFTLGAYQYEMHPNKVSLSHPEHGIERCYPAFFPYGDIMVSFDSPLLKGSGDYDNMEIFGEENLYTSSFSVENLRLEAFHYVERLGFVETTTLTSKATVVDEFGTPFSEKIPPAELIRMIKSGELVPEEYEKLKSEGKIPFGFCGGQDPFRITGRSDGKIHV